MITHCPPSAIIAVYYPGRQLHLCHCCGKQIVYFNAAASWSHVPDTDTPPGQRTPSND